MCAYHSPQLIAVNHVLHRLLMPRHSPCALSHFTFSYHVLRVLSKTVVIFSRLSESFYFLLVVLFTRSFLICICYFILFSSCSVLFTRTGMNKHPVYLLISILVKRLPTRVDFFQFFWTLPRVSRSVRLLVGTNGLEPSTSRLSGVRSNHLSYAPNFMVEMRRIELLTPCLQSRCSPSWATPP